MDAIAGSYGIVLRMFAVQPSAMKALNWKSALAIIAIVAFIIFGMMLDNPPPY